MARRYAGVLGFVAFATVLAHGVMHGRGAEATLQGAILALAALATVGAIVGRFAEWMVDESARARMRSQLAKARDDRKVKETQELNEARAA